MQHPPSRAISSNADDSKWRMNRKKNFRIVRGKALPRCLHRKVHEPTTHEKQRTLPFLSSQDAESNRLKSPQVSTWDAKLKTATVSTPTTRTEPLPCSPLCSSRKRARSCLEKRFKRMRTNSLKATSLEVGSEIISDLCAVVSFIVLCLIRYFTTNRRTLELTYFIRQYRIK